MIEPIRDLEGHIAAPEITLRTAMMRLNAAPSSLQFQLVCDAAGRLLGTITDGDIRRAILRGVALDDSVTRCMNAAPIAGRTGDAAGNQKKLRDISARTAFLPVLDEAGVVAEILVLSARDFRSFEALVMAGGFGKRLGARTQSVPKPLLPIGEKPILGHILDHLEAAKARRIFISVHYLAEQIEDFVAQRQNRVAIEFLHEGRPLGTAGAIGMLPDPMSEPFMVLNGDILTTLDFIAFQEFHLRHDCDGTIAVAQHQVTIPFGVIRHGNDGQFLGIDEKPTLSRFVAAGIYLLSPRFRALVRRGEVLDMPDLFERGRGVGLGAELFPVHEYWTDVGRPEDLERASARHPQS